MALKALNSVAGFSVGEVPSIIIDANGNVTSNNLSVSNVANLGPVGNVKITGGSSGQIISTDGLGNLSFVSISTSSISNGTSNVSVPSLNGNVTISVAGTSNVVVVSTSNVTITGDLSAGNITATGNLSANNYLVTPATRDLIVAPATQITRFYSNVNPYTDVGYDLGNTLARWNNVFANTGNFTGNITAGGLLTNNLYYANGNPWDLQEAAGSNTQIQYNDGSNNFGASAAFTWDYAGNVLFVNGNANITNTLIGNVGNFSGNVTVPNLTVNLELQANTANFDGNVVIDQWLTVSNVANIGNLNVVTNVTSNLVPNANATYNLGNSSSQWANVYAQNFVGNISGNITAPGANTEVIFNDANIANAVANLTYNKTANGNGGRLNVGNGAGGEITTDNLITSYANVNGNLNVTANISAGNVSASGTISTTGAGGDITMTGGNISGANVISANIGSFTANVSAANFLGALANGTSNVKVFNGANVEISINGTANTVSFTTTGVYVDGEINTTGGNVLSNGNVTANGFLVGANANVTGEAVLGSVKTANIIAPSGNITISAVGVDKSINLAPTGNGVVDVANTKITNLKDPTADQDAATKKYVDDVAQGLNIHDACYAATANTLTVLTGGGTITYNNGTGGVGANLVLSGTYTKDYTTANTFDGNTTATTGSRILVKSEANAVHNGIYVVDSATVLTRATDFNSVPEVEAGDFTFVQDGDTYNDTGWVQTATVTTIGTDPIVFTQFSGAGTYTAGSGLTLTGSVFSVNVDNVTTAISNGNVIVKTGANLTTPNLGDATFSSLAWNNLSNGNVTANNLSISNIANITGNLRVDGLIQSNGNISSNSFVNANNLFITTNANVQGNILGANITANSTVFTTSANISGNLITSNATVNLELSGNTANFSGNVIVPNLSVNLAIAGNTANFSGNVAVPNLTVNTALAGNTANFSGNVVVPNLTVNLEFQGNTANFDGNVVMDSWLTVANTANVGNLRTNNLLYANGSPWDLQQAAGSNTQIQYNDGSNDFGASANFAFDYSAQQLNLNGTANIATAILLGNTTIQWGNVTTTSTSANQTIASLSTTGVTGIEFLVKGVDSGGKYSVATVQAVTDGSSVDYSTFGTVNLNGFTGSLAVNISGGFVRLQVTPSSSNSTVWTTQARTI